MSKTKDVPNRIRSGYMRVVPDSGHFGNIDMIITYVRQRSAIGKLDINELVKQLQTTKEFGYELKQYKTKMHKKWKTT